MTSPLPNVSDPALRKNSSSLLKIDLWAAGATDVLTGQTTSRGKDDDAALARNRVP
jgi:hypothetical protein